MMDKYRVVLERGTTSQAKTITKEDELYAWYLRFVVHDYEKITIVKKGLQKK